MISIAETYASKLSGLISRNDSRIAVPALLTKISTGPRLSTADLVKFQSVKSTGTGTMQGHSLTSSSKCDLVRDNANTFSAFPKKKAFANSLPIPAKGT